MQHLSPEWLREEIEGAERKLDEAGRSARRLWERILITPERWRCAQYGRRERAWVVAVMGRSCLYHNPVEEGWGWGAFRRWGTVSEYHSEQLELHHVVLQTREVLAEGGRADWPTLLAAGPPQPRPPRTIAKSMQGLFVLAGIALVAAGFNHGRALIFVGLGLIVLAVVGRVLGRE